MTLKAAQVVDGRLALEALQPSNSSILRTSSVGVSHLCRPGKDAGES